MEVDKLLEGNIREVSRALTLIEAGGKSASDLVSSLPERPYHVIGITGSPGAGKSTLTDTLAMKSAEKFKTAVIAVDPSSPFTGGAFLGDRIRMKKAASKDGVFIRSMASRGKVGGLSPAIYDAVELLGRCGFERIFVETVGAGQSEIDVVNLADMVLLVLAPGLGDDVQTFKAGIMEIGNLYIINKMDMSGADKLASRVRTMLEMSGHPGKVIMTNAVNSTNVDSVIDGIEEHLHFLVETDKIIEKREKRFRYNKLNTVYEIIKEKFNENDKLKKLINIIEDFDGRG